MDNLPWFRSLSWYFLVASNYFFYGETLVEQFGVVVNKVDFLPVLVKYHRLISFSMYIMGKEEMTRVRLVMLVLQGSCGSCCRWSRSITSASSLCSPGPTWPCSA